MVEAFAGSHKYQFKDVKYLHPGQSHMNPMLNAGCQCVFLSFQFHADQVLNWSKCGKSLIGKFLAEN